MDEGLSDEVAPVNVAEGAHLHGKESEYTLKPPESSSTLDTCEVVLTRGADYPENSFHVLADILEGKNVDQGLNHVDASEQPSASPCSMDDAGNMVEELMVRNYDNSNLAIVGPSNNRERMQTRQNQWQHLYQLRGGSGSGSSPNEYWENGQSMPSVWGDVRYTSFPEFLGQKTSSDNHKLVREQLANTECKGVSSNTISHGGIRTKILSKSGFSEFFVKNTLKGKGIILRGPSHDGMKPVPIDQNNGNIACENFAASNASLSLGAKIAAPSSTCTAGRHPGSSGLDGVSLREWLNSKTHKVNKVECLHVFKQIVDVVDYSHTQGVALRDLRPSSFKLLRSNQVKYIGSGGPKDALEGTMNQYISLSESHAIRRRPADQMMFSSFGVVAKEHKFSENMNPIRQWPQFSSKYGFKFETANEDDINTSGTQISFDVPFEPNPNAQQQLQSTNDLLEEKWYASPEELSEGICTISSNIYGLGVLLFELLGRFDSERAHSAAMLDLRHRILPPHFLSENPKEAGFCLWLLHPEPSARPTTRDILQSEVINGSQDVSAEELSSSIDQDDAESELLLHFLVSLKEHMQKDASNLVEEIKCLEADIEEVGRRSCTKASLVHSCFNTKLLEARESTMREPSSSKALSRLSPSSNANENLLIDGIDHLESAYFSMRSKIQFSETDANARQDKDLLRNHENWSLAQDCRVKENTTDCLGAFLDGLCKYARYNKFEVCGLLRTGELNNSANVICSLSFDRDADYFAAAGVSKKIKIFEFNALFDDSADIHYPVIEMSNKSKLSCICWNNYIKNYLVSTGYDGVVKLWDVSTGQAIFHYSEHEKRAWSVDFSPVYPTKLASGSDDCSVKLWNVNEKNSLATIRNIANVCCVQFSPHSTHLLAFGSADYRTYCYDLRNVRTPWCVVAGHEKAVSYVKFLDPETLVTASTDNSLKLWDLNKTNPSGLSTSACSLTLTGHTNEKNFVGLSVTNGYIACGSETNEVYAYYRSLPMPITSHQFGSIDPISGKETDDDNGQFVSSVCWRGKSDMIIAANSSGCIKLLQMI